MTDMLVKAAENVNIVNNLNNILMPYGHGQVARIDSRMSIQSCSVQSSFKSENRAWRILWQVRLKKRIKFLMFLRPTFEYFGTFSPDAALDALSIFRAFRLMAFSCSCVVHCYLFLYKLSTTTKHVDKKQNYTFLNLKHGICREGNMMCFLCTILMHL